MSLGSFIVEQEERQKAYERAMARYHARKAREARERAKGGESGRRESTPTTLGRGARRLSREEAIAMIAKKHPRTALKLLHEHFGGRTHRRST